MMPTPAHPTDLGYRSDADGDDDTNQWTRVLRRETRSRRRPAAAVSSPLTHRPLAPRTTGSLTVDQIRDEHSRIQPSFRSRPSYESLRSLVALNTAGHGHITRAICLGNGSFDPSDGILSKARRAHVQTAAFLAIVDVLSERAGHSIPCFFQEPLYTEADKSFLQSLGHTVVDTPAAFEMVDATSLVFGIHLYHTYYAAVLAHGFPAMLIGTSWSVWDEPLRLDKAEKARLGQLQKIDAEFDKLEFPRERHDYDFSDTCIYWRRVDNSRHEQRLPSRAEISTPEAEAEVQESPKS